MLEDGKISGRQAAFLIISTILPTSIMLLPGIIYQEAAQDSWMSIILVTFFGMAAGLVIAALGMRFPDKTIVQYAGLLTGRVLGKAIGLLYIVFFIYINTFVIRQFGELLVTMFMPETPLLVFLIGLMMASAYSIRCGLEVLARVNEIVLPVVLGLLLLIVLLIIPEMQAQKLTPVLEKGIVPVLRGIYYPALFFAETAVMLMIIPFLNRPRKAGGIILKGIVTVGLFQLLTMLATIMVFGPRTARIQFPVLILARQISIAELIERAEPFVMLIWVLGGFVKVAVFYYCAVLGTAQLLNLKDYKSLVLPTGVLLTVLSVLLWGDVLELTRQITKLLPPVFIPIEAGLPLLLLVLARLRGNRGGGR
ncbi:spore germination protein GerKB [Desulfocucumis palustris]|uniref:Spore germination protein GerKB n=1 Tax=Desulfocucumis palustris TaxID=1898651 RepID=A0A2L2XGJ1_9FIRM|nr:endospore germination permease [Desulfocucumis palustris]GBF35114.1 spore germination protein GerKB [Desulfocucumis palustris]